MRSLPALVLIAACAAAGSANAQSASKDRASRALMGAAFADPASGTLRAVSSSRASTFAVRSNKKAAAAGGAFATPAYSGTALDQRTLLATDRQLPQGQVRWRTGETLLNVDGDTVDAMRLSVGGIARAPGGLEVSDEAFDFTYTRGWLGAVRGRTDDGVAFDITPRAGLGMSNAGGQAIAGAMIRFGDIDFEDEVKSRLRAMGVPQVTDGARFGDRGRWYLFAAADGRAVGLNLLRNEDGWSRQGLTTDEAAVIGEAQVGVGWRRGAMQASFGMVHREIKGKAMRGLDAQKVEDQAVAFTLSIKPSK